MRTFQHRASIVESAAPSRIIKGRIGACSLQPKTAPRMMILFDPDLGTDLSRSAVADAARAVRAKSSMAQPTRAASPRRVPSARSLARFLQAAQTAVRLRGQVTVLLTTDAAIRALNRRFRGKNKSTDVLSFPADAGLGPDSGPEKIAGDLAISMPTAGRQAVAQHHPLATEIKVLILHGLLHLAGYDHETDTGRMARRERQLRARLGLPMGLIERAAAPVPAAAKSRKSAARKIPRPLAESRTRSRRP
ncbi:MAG TPA: rRNA maturation RNase YbeY [Terracidiphilus sp.]|jgi:probable rRNA maturation factor|nr:rRNA maturation RNase YbeY [Terracidiphilus sp.]